jgi:hypothetical protein
MRSVHCPHSGVHIVPRWRGKRIDHKPYIKLGWTLSVALSPPPFAVYDARPSGPASGGNDQPEFRKKINHPVGEIISLFFVTQHQSSLQQKLIE